MHETVLRHINNLVCGEPLAGDSQGVALLLNRSARDMPLKRCISVGCGDGVKELDLLANGVVESFELFEISEHLCKAAEANAARLGLSDRVMVRCENAFDAGLKLRTYDLVHWNMSLHHMLDVYVAVEWSYRMLRIGGWLSLSEYIGSKRFQFPDIYMTAANAVRGNVPASWLVDPRSPDTSFPDNVQRRNLRNMILSDPTESPDSTNILPALMNFFPHAKPIMLGGIIYSIALDPLYGSIAQDGADLKYLENLLRLDAVLSESGMNLYMAAVVQKID